MVRTISDGIVISPIRNGTVIDHITPGEGLTVLRILGIRDGTHVTVIVASNVTSSRGGRKDMVKIENRPGRSRTFPSDRITRTFSGCIIANRKLLQT